MIGKHFIVTGATGSLGESLIHYLNLYGAKATIIVRNKEKAQILQNKYNNIEDTIILDLNNSNEIINMGSLNHKYDGIINNAGLGYFKSNDNHSFEDIMAIYNTNLVNLILLQNILLPNMKRGASIVNIASISGKVTTPYASHYAASKAGLINFSNALRLERPDLHVLTVNPGPFKSSFHLKADPSGSYNESTEFLQLDIDVLANRIIKGMINKMIEINEPKWMDVGLRFYQLAPRTIEKIFKKVFLSKM